MRPCDRVEAFARKPLMLLVLLTTIAAALISGCGPGTRPRAPETRAAATAATAPQQPSPTPSPASSAGTAAARYQVQAGDTLGIIAQRFHTSVGALEKANRLAGDTIAAGQTLEIPAGPTVRPAAARTRVADQSPARAVSRGRTDTKAVALTFDAGADVGFTRLILDTLKRNGIHATFGMTGQWAEDNPELVKEMAADGHAFMNHTWDHQSFTGLSTKTKPLTAVERASEIDRTEDIIHALTGKTTYPYFRSPFGDQDNSVEADAGRDGYRYDVLWTVDTGGWARASAGQIVAEVSHGAAPGAIVVMHVGAESQDGPALQAVIETIRQKGLGFATIPDLIAGG